MEGLVKSAEISEKTRKEGNKLYGKKNHNKDIHKAILWTYSKSVAYAPAKSEQLAAAYSNRSALLKHLGYHEESLVDIDRALQITKSEELKKKLIARKENLETSNEISLKSLSLDDTEEKSSNKQNNNGVSSFLKIAKPSAIVPCASDSVLLKYNDTFGRHYVAARDIKPGEVILVEEGYICIPKTNLRYYLCSHCLQFTWNGIPCESCPFAVYCSEDCKKKAWQDYHSIECQILPHMEFLKSDNVGCVMADIVIALRVFSKAVMKEGLDAILKEAETMDNEKNKTLEGLLTEGVIRSDRFRSYCNLTSNVQHDAKKHQTGALNVTDLINLLLVKSNILDSKKNSENKVPNVLITQLKKLLNKIRHISDVNAFSYQGTICECPNEYAIECYCGSDRGLIIAPCTSLISHSCAPNVTRIFLPKKKVVLYTVAFVKKGEQLFDGYGPSIRMEKRLRQKILQDKFYFTCKCRACTENWPLEEKIKDLLDQQMMTNILCQINIEFKKFYPNESELFMFQDLDELWGRDEGSLAKIKLICELIFKYCNDYMKAYFLTASCRFAIDNIIFDSYGERCAIPGNCV